MTRPSVSSATTSMQRQASVRFLDLAVTAAIVATVGAMLAREGLHRMAIVGAMLLVAITTSLLSELAFYRPWLEMSNDESEKEIRSDTWELALAVAVVCAALGTLLLCEFTTVAVGSSFALVALMTFIMFRSIRYGSKRAPLDHVITACRPFFLTVMICTVLYGAVSSFKLARLDPDLANSQAILVAWQLRLQLAATAMCIGLTIMLVYAVWSVVTLRFTRARLSAIKDIVICIEESVSDARCLVISQPQVAPQLLDQATSEQLQSAPGGRRETDVSLLLNGVRDWMRLSSWDAALRRLKSPRPVVTSVWYFVPAETGDHFIVSSAVWPSNAPGNVRGAFDWIADNHKPKRLDELAFRKLVRKARDTGGRRWKKAYLRQTERHDVISVCGWVYEKQQILTSYDAEGCCAFNTSYSRCDKIQACSSEEQLWLRPGSFIACPVPGAGRQLTGVLIVLKNVRNGFTPEDVEPVVLSCQLLGRINEAISSLQRRDNEKVPHRVEKPVLATASCGYTLSLTRELKGGTITPNKYAYDTERIIRASTDLNETWSAAIGARAPE